MSKLTFDDLHFIFTQPRTDHPSRKNILSGEPYLLPRLGHGRNARGYGEFIPNPPGCVGLRKVPKGFDVKQLDDIQPPAKGE